MKNQLLSLLFLLFTTLITTVNAQVTIGTGTSATGYTPFFGLWDYSWSNTIYTAGEIGTSGNIASVAFNVAGFTAPVTMNNQRIYVRHVPSTTASYSAATYISPGTAGFTLVFSGSVTYTANGWKTFTFSTPFNYNGVDNLEFLFENSDGSYSVDYPLFRSTSTAGYRTRLDYKDISFPSSCTNCALLGAIPNVQLTFCSTIAGTATATSTQICTGTGTTLNLTGQTTGSTIQWQSSTDNITFAAITGATSTSYITPNLLATTYYRAIVTNNGCFAIGNSVSVTVSSLTLGTTSATSVALCSGENTTLSVTGQTSGASIQWLSSPNNVTFTPITGAISNPYATPALTLTTFYKAAITNGGCAATGNTITVTVGSAVAGTASAVSPSICTGTNTTLNLTGQTYLSYIQWQTSIDNITFTDIIGAAGATFTSYTTPNLTQTTYYRVKVTKNGCVKIGNTVTVTVSSSDAGTTSATNLAICSGTNTTLNVTSQTVGASIQWQSSTDNITFADITGETSASYVTPNLSATTYFRVIVTNGGCAVAGNTITINVSAVNTGTASAANTAICTGTNTTLNLTGQTIGASIQWQSSIDNITFTNITGATSATYTTPNLSQTTYYQATVTVGGCTIVGNTISVSVASSTAGVASATNTSICIGEVTTLNIVGQTVGASIQWSSSSDDITFTAITGATNATYTTSSLYTATYLVANVTNGGCTATSNTVIIAVSSPTLGTTSATSTTVCSGTNTILSIFGQSGLIQWQSSTDNITFTNIIGATSANYTTPILTQTTYYRVRLSSGGCVMYGNTVTVTVSIISAGTISSAGSAVCGGTINTLHESGQTVGASIQWQSSPDNITFTNIAGQITDTYVTPSLLAGTTMYFRAVITYGSCVTPTNTLVF